MPFRTTSNSRVSISRSPCRMRSWCFLGMEADRVAQVLDADLVAVDGDRAFPRGHNVGKIRA